MPQIRYTAVDRGFLASGHSATTEYTFDIDFEAYPRRQRNNGDFERTLGGQYEGYLFSIDVTYQIQTDIRYLSGSPSQVAVMEEFLSSVANHETFEIDFTGYSGSSGTFVDVVLISETVTDSHVGGVAKKYAFEVQRV